MLNAFLQGIEDPKRPLLGPNYWILKKWGLILPESLIARFFCKLYHFAAFVFIVTEYVQLFVIISDLDLALTNLEISMLSTICCSKCYSFVFCQERWIEVIEYITESDLFERQIADPIRKEIIDKYTKYSRTVTYYYWVLVFITTLVVFGTPVGQYIGSHHNESLNTTEPFPHIFISWMPFDKEHFPGSWATICWHSLFTIYGALTIASFDTSVVVMMVFFGGKLDLLRERCKQMLGSDGIPISDEEAIERIRELHQTHVDIMK